MSDFFVDDEENPDDPFAQGFDAEDYGAGTSSGSAASTGGARTRYNTAGAASSGIRTRFSVQPSGSTSTITSAQSAQLATRTRTRLGMLFDGVPELGQDNVLATQLATSNLSDDQMIVAALDAADSSKVSAALNALRDQSDEDQRRYWEGLTHSRRVALMRANYQPPAEDSGGGGGWFGDLVDIATGGAARDVIGSAIGTVLDTGAAAPLAAGVNVGRAAGEQVLGALSVPYEQVAQPAERFIQAGVSTGGSPLEAIGRSALSIVAGPAGAAINAATGTTDAMRSARHRDDLLANAMEADGGYTQTEIDDVRQRTAREATGGLANVGWTFDLVHDSDDAIDPQAEIDALGAVGGDVRKYLLAKKLSTIDTSDPQAVQDAVASLVPANLTPQSPEYAQTYSRLLSAAGYGQALAPDEVSGTVNNPDDLMSETDSADVQRAVRLMSEGRYGPGQLVAGAFGVESDSGWYPWLTGGTELLTSLMLDPVMLAGAAVKGYRATRLAVRNLEDIGAIGEEIIRAGADGANIGARATQYRGFRFLADHGSTAFDRAVDPVTRQRSMTALANYMPWAVKGGGLADLHMYDQALQVERGFGLRAGDDGVRDLVDYFADKQGKMALVSGQWGAATSKYRELPRLSTSRVVRGHMADWWNESIRFTNPDYAASFSKTETGLAKLTERANQADTARLWRVGENQWTDDLDGVLDYARRNVGAVEDGSLRFGYADVPLGDLPAVRTPGQPFVTNGLRLNNVEELTPAEVLNAAETGMGRFLGNSVIVAPVRPAARSLGRGLSNFLSGATTLVPKYDVLPTLGPNALNEFRNLSRWGGWWGISREQQDRFLAEFLVGAPDAAKPIMNIEQRKQVAGNFLELLFRESGALDHPGVRQGLDRFLDTERFGYGPFDKVVRGGTETHGAYLASQYSEGMGIPNGIDLYAQGRKIGLYRKMFGTVNSPMVEAFMGKAWKPAMLLRLGFIPRAAGEEALAFILREGPAAYAQGWLARSAQYTNDDSKLALMEQMQGRLGALEKELGRWKNPTGPDALLGTDVQAAAKQAAVKDMMRAEREVWGEMRRVDFGLPARPALRSGQLIRQFNARINPGGLDELGMATNRFYGTEARRLLDGNLTAGETMANHATDWFRRNVVEAVNDKQIRRFTRGIASTERHGAITETISGNQTWDVIGSQNTFDGFLTLGARESSGRPGIVKLRLSPEFTTKEVTAWGADPLESFHLTQQIDVTAGDDFARPVVQALRGAVDPEAAREILRLPADTGTVLVRDRLPEIIGRRQAMRDTWEAAPDGVADLFRTAYRNGETDDTVAAAFRRLTGVKERVPGASLSDMVDDYARRAGADDPLAVALRTTQDELAPLGRRAKALMLSDADMYVGTPEAIASRMVSAGRRNLDRTEMQRQARDFSRFRTDRVGHSVPAELPEGQTWLWTAAVPQEAVTHLDGLFSDPAALQAAMDAEGVSRDTAAAIQKIGQMRDANDARFAAAATDRAQTTVASWTTDNRLLADDVSRTLTKLATDSDVAAEGAASARLLYPQSAERRVIVGGDAHFDAHGVSIGPGMLREEVGPRQWRVDPQHAHSAEVPRPDALDPLDDWADVLRQHVGSTFQTKDGRVAHDLVEASLSPDGITIADVNNTPRDFLPDYYQHRPLYVPREGNAWERMVRGWFDGVVGPAISSIARQPMFLHAGGRRMAEADQLLELLTDTKLEAAATKIMGHAGLDAADVRSLLVTGKADDLAVRLAFTSGRKVSRSELELDAAVSNIDNALAEVGMGADEFDTLQRWAQHRSNIENTAFDQAFQGALADVVPYIDDHRVRSQVASVVRNVAPFQFAEEQFLKRWARTLYTSPEAIRRGQLYYGFMRHVGVVHPDGDGNDVFNYPGGPALAELLNKVPFLGGMVSMPVAVPLSGQMRYVLPGLDSKGFTVGSPVVSLPLTAVRELFPETKRSVNGIESTLFGQQGTDRSAVAQLMPSTLVNIYDAVTDSDRTASAMILAMQAREAEAGRARAEGRIADAERLEMPDPKLDPAGYEDYRDEISGWARNYNLARAAFGWMGPTTPAISPDNLSQEYLNLLQYLGPDEAMGVFLSQHPGGEAWTTFRTESVGGGRLPSYAGAVDWYFDNGEWLRRYPSAAPYLIPAGSEGAPEPSSSEGFQIYDRQVALGLRKQRDPDEWVTAYRFKAGSAAYFDASEKYQEGQAKFDDAIDGTASTVEKARLRAGRDQATAAWSAWKDHYAKTNPTFWNELTSPDGEQRRTIAVRQLRDALDDPEVPPSQLAYSEPMTRMLDVLDSYNAAKQRLLGDRRAGAEKARDELKRAYVAWNQEMVDKVPQLRSFWSGLLFPASGISRADAAAF